MNSTGSVTSFVVTEPATSNQFMPKPKSVALVCVCKCQPTWSVGQESVSAPGASTNATFVGEKKTGATTAIEPSTASLFAQTSPGRSDGKFTTAKPATGVLNNWN